MKFNEYYENYLSLHQNLWCRRLHVLGQITTITYIALAIYFKVWAMLLLAPFIVYPFAWSGHYFFENNKPAAFRNPFYAKMADAVMFKQWILGEIKR
tara:strand:- start:1037 stop:1327 length:291 start_codon:yes stop_codon:yes gene_type:complete